MKFTAYTFVFLAVFRMASAQEKVPVLTLEKGQSFNRVITTESQVEQTVDQEKRESILRLTSYSKYEVIDVNPLGFSLKVHYDSLIMHIETKDFKTVYTSESKDENDLMKVVLSEMTDKPFKITVTPQGKIIETQYMEDMFSTIDEKLKRAHFEKRENTKSLMRQYFAGKGFISNFNLISHVLPEHAVVDNEKWIIATDIYSNYVGINKNEYEIQETNPEEIIIKGYGKITTEPHIAHIQPTGLPVAYDLKGEAKSEHVLSSETGWVKNAKIVHKFEGEEITRKTPQMKEDLIISLKVKTTIKVDGY